MGMAGRRAGRVRRGAGRTGVLGPVVAVATLAMVAAGAPAAVADSGSGTPAPQRIGAAPHLPHGAVRTTAPSSDTALDLGVVLAPRDPAGLKKFIADVSTPGSPLYHQYLKPGTFGTEFGAGPAAVATVRTALKAQGLTVGTLESDGLTLPVHTTVGAAGKALHTGFTGYRTSDGRHGVANTTAPSLRADAAADISGITGLNTLAQVHSHLAAKPAAKVVAPASAGSQASGTVSPHIAGKTPVLCSSIKSLLTSGGVSDGTDYWSASTLASAYGMANQPNVGTGVSVGIFELENYSTKDIAAYQSCYGTKVSVSAVKVDGGPKIAANANIGYGMESALDIEDLIGLVPQASLLVYQGPDAENATEQNVLDVYQKMVSDDRAKVISSSWGGCTVDQTDAFMSAESLIFEQAAAQGQTVTAASGDSGSSDCWYDPNNTGTSLDPNGSLLSVDDPAGQPYVLSVGGTRMTGSGGSTQRTWNSEEVGRDADDLNPGATGGGVSTAWSMDATTDYQTGVTAPGYADVCNAPAGETCRQVPDVSALGDPKTGYLIAAGYTSAEGQPWYIIGGTSGASPTWAALAAQADLDLGCAANGPVGFVNPALYKLPSSAFRDITTGTNYLAHTGAQPAGSYSAASGAGYDLATGLGTPHARSVISGLCTAVPQTQAGTFTSVNPTRILDTRHDIGRSGTSPVAADGTVSLQVAGSAGGAVPATGVTAVVLNLTVTDTKAGGYLTAYPDGTPRPTASNLNWVTGRTVPNLVVVPVGADGKVDLYNASSGTTHLVADVFGYYSTATDGATYYPTGPTRVLDTRSKVGVTTTTPVKSNGVLSLQIAGAGGVPATGATAVVLNVTATGQTSTGHLIAYPDGTTRPESSNLNWLKGKTVPNLVVMPVGADGKVDFYNASTGTTHFVADVFGYYSADTGGALYHTAGPTRLLDTRTGVGASKAGALASTSTLALSLNDGNVLAHAKAVVLNVTVVSGTSDGAYLVVYPDGTTRPTASNLNWSKGQTIANLVTVPVTDGKVDFHVNTGSVQVVADLFGYYT
ncbi:Pro-kumamolisin, activation domain [Actinacidiphila yanglinensis]|uniref:Pro-kumamolisin, activation domain n=1 Tax=Actinacidiphila yanglinensis TaxID=310779 RepID=A0A1H5Z6K0_9ACTN|nr:S53 family peptidase [Actinacidiphila yanglinensis]SEG31971.1 Pro-kumamolisin, activation domain [Actinacidiphila yanglinensis]